MNISFEVHAHSVRASFIGLGTIILLSLGACGGGYGGGGSSSCGGAYGPSCPVMSGGSPSVALTSPGASVNRSVTLTATPTAPNGIMRVDFLVDGSVIGMATTSPYTTTWNTSTYSDGSHSVSARITDNQNLTADSAAASVNVANNIVLAVALSPREEVPAPASTASGTGQLNVNLSSGVISGNIVLSGMTANMAHIHDAYAGNNGNILIPFAAHATIANRWDLPANSTLTAAQVDRLIGGALYVNAHSTTFTGGEVRGQLKPSNIKVVLADMSGAQEVPTVAITAAGVAAVTVDSLAGLASVHVNSTGVDDATMAHIHRGATGVNGPIFINLTKDTAPGKAGHWSVEAQTLTANDVSDFNNAGWYANMHTPAFVNGAIRGQISPPATATTLTQLQSSLFGSICSVCHTGGGASLPSSMNLSTASATFAALVGVNSVEQASLKRVSANDAANSYVIRKLEGTAGITGSRMPLGGPFLDQATIDTVKAWINAGALNN